jgi:hypothetical protein
MEISVAAQQVPSLQNVQNVNLSPTTESEKTSSTLKEKSSYYCNECQRSLNDENAFDKHLKSELHFKRSLKIESVVNGKESRNKSVNFSTKDTYTKQSFPEQTIENENESLNSKYQLCPTCLSSVEKIKFGKHLVSHYHHHMSLSGSKDRRDTLVLENIEKIVKECPFQCQICNFFCNWEQDFSYHWILNHENTAEERNNEDKVFWCSLCQVFTPTCKEMGTHLNGDYHNDILSVINRCVPMILKVKFTSLATISLIFHYIYCPLRFKCKKLQGSNVKRHFFKVGVSFEFDYNISENVL